MGAISPLHIVLVLVVALIVVGPGKLPEVGAALGKSIREFRIAASDAAAPEATPPAAVATTTATAPTPAPAIPAPAAVVQPATADQDLPGA